MGDFTTNYLAELTASLTAEMLKGIGRKLRKKISGTEKEQAIERCVHIGIAALLATARTRSKEELHLLSNIFLTFFKEEDVGKELGALLRGHPLNREELLYLFEHAGFEASKLPGVDFNQAMTAFEAAFLTCATDETTLQDTIQTAQKSEVGLGQPNFLNLKNRRDQVRLHPTFRSFPASTTPSCAPRSAAKSATPRCCGSSIRFSPAAKGCCARLMTWSISPAMIFSRLIVRAACRSAT